MFGKASVPAFYFTVFLYLKVMKKHISILTFETCKNILFKIKFSKGNILFKHAIIIDYWWFGKYYSSIIFIEL